MSTCLNVHICKSTLSDTGLCLRSLRHRIRFRTSTEIEECKSGKFIISKQKTCRRALSAGAHWPLPTGADRNRSRSPTPMRFFLMEAGSGTADCGRHGDQYKCKMRLPTELPQRVRVVELRCKRRGEQGRECFSSIANPAAPQTQTQGQAGSGLDFSFAFWVWVPVQCAPHKSEPQSVDRNDSFGLGAHGGGAGAWFVGW
ncbi:hypothetical protein C8R43DRAFT_1021490 [Mycena crocata]|nr:hypothetical protein C8R43DRAFT_1021490 [Mycena crocata]